VNAAEYYMMHRGVKIRLNMSPSDWIFTFGHVGVTDVLKKPVNCSRELWKWYTDCFAWKQSGAPRALAYTCPTAAQAAQNGLRTRKEEESTVDHLIVTVFAPDKPGQVEQIASCIANHGGNWLESRMTHMAGQFAGILRIGVPTEAHTRLREALQGLSAHGIRVQFADIGIETPPTWKPINMELVGADRPGIVRDVTRLLTEQGVNVQQLVTNVEPAPMSSELLFRANALLGLPQTLSLDVLQKRLETLADDLMVELKLKTDE
jgi:glycine cleavage system regulatory protein